MMLCFGESIHSEESTPDGSCFCAATDADGFVGVTCGTVSLSTVVWSLSAVTAVRDTLPALLEPTDVSVYWADVDVSDARALCEEWGTELSRVARCC